MPWSASNSVHQTSQKLLHALQPRNSPGEPQGKKRVQQLAHRTRRILQRLALSTNRGADRRRGEIVKVRDEVIGMLRLDAVTGEAACG